MRQQMLDQVGLMRTELVALAAAEERALRLRRGAVIGHSLAPRAIAGGRAHRSV